MRLFIYLVSAMICFQILSCAEENKPQTNAQNSNAQLSDPPKIAEKQVFEPGKLYSDEVVDGAADNRYALRLPSQYQADKKYPILIFFDAQGNGKEPLQKYAALGDDFQVILVGSNSSKNGQVFGQSQQIYQQLFPDLKRKLSLDEGRIWLAGFSGGARVATSLAQNHTEIEAVFACEAANPAQASNRFIHFGFVGMQDFNYQEMRHVEEGFGETKLPHELILMNVGHEWPPLKDFRLGVQFVVLRDMANGKILRNDSLIKAADDAYRSEVELCKRAANEEWELSARKQRLDAMEGLLDMTKEKAAFENLNSPEKQKLRAAQASQEEAKEMALRNQYGDQIQTGTLAGWTKNTNELHQKAKGTNTRNAWLHKRILNFLSLNVYFQVTGNLKQNNLPAAEHFQQIYALVDPDNAEHAYLLANIRARQGRKEDVLQALEAAEKLGFKDAARLKNDPDFQALQNEERIRQLLDRLRVTE